MTSPGGYTQVGQTPINNQRLSGTQVFNFPASSQPFLVAMLFIDRTVNGGLNSLAVTDTLTVTFDYSHDGGATWKNIAGETWLGGVYTSTHGGVTVTNNSEFLGIGNGDLGFGPADTFRVTTAASTPVRITGTVTYYA